MAPINRVVRWQMCENALINLATTRANLINELDLQLAPTRATIRRLTTLETMISGSPIHAEVLARLEEACHAVEVAESGIDVDLARIDEEMELAEFETAAAFAELTDADRAGMALHM
jgi:hypothetical protein